jgi:hypothetical protein
MTQFELDLHYAKSLVLILKESLSNSLSNSNQHIVEMDDWISITTMQAGIEYRSDVNFFVNNMVTEDKLQINIFDDFFRYDDSIFSNNKETCHLMINPEDEAEYFQNSLLYTTIKNSGLLISSYIVKHLRCTEIKSIIINLSTLPLFITDSKDYLESLNDTI